jgi:hypothetical protein
MIAGGAKVVTPTASTITSGNSHGSIALLTRSKSCILASHRAGANGYSRGGLDGRWLRCRCEAAEWAYAPLRDRVR